MSEAPAILAIDAARRFGWAYGRAGSSPRSGSVECAGAGASRAAVFSGAGRWITAFLQANPVDLLVIEAAVAGGKQGQTNARTAMILNGLPAVFEFMAYQMGVYDHRRIAVSSVRSHFLGRGNLPGSEAKPAAFAKCHALGWITKDDEDQSFDRSDALALWSYAETTFAPRLAQPVDSLFLAAKRRGATI